MSYSEHDEERIILEYAPASRRVLDIGAYNGRKNSNTLALIEQRGYSGVLVEPSPLAFSQLLALHRDNPKIHLVNAAIGLQRGLKMFYLSLEDQVSTLDEAWATQCIASGVRYTKIFTPVIPLEDLIFVHPPPYDVISVDVEGWSAALFLTTDIRALGAKVIVIEDDGRVEEVVARGVFAGYMEAWRGGGNVILVKP